METLNELQDNLEIWYRKNFNNHPFKSHQQLLGCQEELGELCHAHLKGEQGIRYSSNEILKLKKDAIGDLVMFLACYCSSEGFRLSDCVDLAWNEVKSRNWDKNKLEGK